MRRLSKLVGRMRRPRPARDPADLLPVELWDEIFSFSTIDLLVLARVCKLWNERCIALYFLSEGITSEDLIRGELKIRSKDLSALLVYTYRDPALRALDCRINIVRSDKALNAIAALTEHCPRLESIRVQFTYESGHLVAFHNVVPQGSGLFTRYDTAFRRLLLAVCRDLPFVFVSNSSIFMLQPGDIEAHAASDEQRTGDGEFSWIRPHAWDIWVPGRIGFPVFRGWKRVLYLESMHALGLQRVNSAFWLAIVNPETTRKLELHPPMANTNLAVSRARLAIILPFVSLPNLRKLVLAATIDSSVLGGLIKRHCATLETIVVESLPTGRPVSPQLSIKCPFPMLTTVECLHAEDLFPILDAFQEAAQLRTIIIPYIRSDAFRNALACLSHLSTDITLVLRVPDASRHSSEPLEADAAVVEPLFCVHELRIELRRAQDGLGMLPWIALFPALRRVEFVIRLLPKETPVDHGLKQRAMAVLNSVSRVDVEWDRW